MFSYLDERIFAIGDYISTDGLYGNTILIILTIIEYITQGNKNCLNPMLVQIGAMNIEN